jgi:phage antirepressor YoqD-like protein
MNEIALNGDKRMTVKEVAEALNVSEQTIRYWTRKEFPEIVENGKATYLTESQAVAIKGLIGTGRNDLSNIAQVKNVTTELEISQMTLKVIQYHVSKNKELEAELSAVKPKAELANRMLNTDNLRTISDVGKILGKPKKIFTDMIEQNILFRSTSHGKILPYQKYIDEGFFIVRYTLVKINENEKRIPQTYVTAKGEEFIVNKIYAPKLGM